MGSLISIIIPAYNSAKYIETTLQDLFSQTYQNFEVIIAYDEKTTDNTLDILRRLNKIHPLTIDIGKDTSSGAARNRGLKLAKGDYVIFVDADDGLLPDYLERLHNLLASNDTVDVVCCGHLRVTDKNINNKRLTAEKSDASSCVISMKESLKLFIEGLLPTAPWVYMVRRTVLSENNILFPNYSYGDDAVYVVHVLEKSRMVAICHKNLYLFRQQTSSLTHTLSNNWWRKYDNSIKERMCVLQKYYPDSMERYRFEIVKWIIIKSVRIYKTYDEFEKATLTVMNEYGIIEPLPTIENNSFVHRTAIFCFNKSKRLFYSLAKIYFAGKKLR